MFCRLIIPFYGPKIIQIILIIMIFIVRIFSVKKYEWELEIEI